LVSVAQVGKLRGYIEVYGVASDGIIKPVAWLGFIVNINIDSIFSL